MCPFLGNLLITNFYCWLLLKTLANKTFLYTSWQLLTFALTTLCLLSYSSGKNSCDWLSNRRAIEDDSSEKLLFFWEKNRLFVFSAGFLDCVISEVSFQDEQPTIAWVPLFFNCTNWLSAYKKSWGAFYCSETHVSFIYLLCLQCYS